MALNGWLGNTATWFLICVPDQPQQLSQNDELEWSLVTPFGGWKRIRRYISTTNDGNKNSLWIFFGRVFWFKSTHDFCIILSLLFPSQFFIDGCGLGRFSRDTRSPTFSWSKVAVESESFGTITRDLFLLKLHLKNWKILENDEQDMTCIVASEC